MPSHKKNIIKPTRQETTYTSVGPNNTSLIDASWSVDNSPNLKLFVNIKGHSSRSLVESMSLIDQIHKNIGTLCQQFAELEPDINQEEKANTSKA